MSKEEKLDGEEELDEKMKIPQKPRKNVKDVNKNKWQYDKFLQIMFEWHKHKNICTIIAKLSEDKFEIFIVVDFFSFNNLKLFLI